MKTRPILMSAPMIHALLQGRKMQTRRVVKPQPPFGYDRHCWFDMPVMGWTNEGEPALNWHKVKCPYGSVGDLLWVRETFVTGRLTGLEEHNRHIDQEIYIYRADCSDETPPAIKWKPSIFMPRSASRLTLELTEVRVERLQEITENDAQAEGIVKQNVIVGAHCAGGRHTEVTQNRYLHDGSEKDFEAAGDAYEHLWESINGSGSWDNNPYVWVLSFQVHEVNVDAFLKKHGAAA